MSLHELYKLIACPIKRTALDDNTSGQPVFPLVTRLPRGCNVQGCQDKSSHIPEDVPTASRDAMMMVFMYTLLEDVEIMIVPYVFLKGPYITYIYMVHMVVEPMAVFPRDGCKKCAVAVACTVRGVKRDSKIAAVASHLCKQRFTLHQIPLCLSLLPFWQTWRLVPLGTSCTCS